MVGRVVASLALGCALSPVASGQVKLEYKVPEGTTRQSKTTAKTHQVMTINGMDIETDGEEEGVARSAIGARKADGTIPIEITLDSVKTKIAIAGNEFSIDSADKDAKIDNPQLAFLVDVFKALRGSSYTVVLDSKNNVKFVEGTEKNLQKVADLPPMAAAALKGRFDVERIKSEYDQSHANLPDGLVREGEPWERTESSSIGGGQTLTFKRRYEYKGTVQKDGKTLDKIAVKALDVTYKQDANADLPAKVTKSDLKVDSSEGTILFDREAGMIVERADKTRIKGDMTMDITAANMEFPVKLDLTLDSKTTVTKVEK
jgi:hypothetical protein